MQVQYWATARVAGERMASSTMISGGIQISPLPIMSMFSCAIKWCPKIYNSVKWCLLCTLKYKMFEISSCYSVSVQHGKMLWKLMSWQVSYQFYDLALEWMLFDKYSHTIVCMKLYKHCDNTYWHICTSLKSILNWIKFFLEKTYAHPHQQGMKLCLPSF